MSKLGSSVLFLSLVVLAIFSYWAYRTSLEPRSRNDIWQAVPDSVANIFEISNKRNAKENENFSPIVSVAPTITSVAVQKPFFVVFGKNLARVQVWAVLTNAQDDTGTNFLIGNALRQSAAGHDERWVLALPLSQVPASAFFATGFDNSGAEVSRVFFNTRQTADLSLPQ